MHYLVFLQTVLQGARFSHPDIFLCIYILVTNTSSKYCKYAILSFLM
jgi:hypothetical protein